MTPDQARSLLELFADLYRIASQSDPAPASNGVPEKTKAKT